MLLEMFALAASGKELTELMDHSFGLSKHCLQSN